MFIIIGLGNIGKEYERTRHNVGFMTLDLIAKKYGIDVTRHHHHSYFGEGRAQTTKIVLAKPDTFMNNSGFAARDLINWYKCEHDELLVIYDDIDLPLGSIRIREGGSAGTHNGMRSIIYQLGFDDFPRIRVGTGAPDGRGERLISHVLSEPTKEETEILIGAMQKACDAAGLIVDKQILHAQELYNTKKPKKAQAANSTEKSGEKEND